MREPLQWKIASLRPASVADVCRHLATAGLGTFDAGWVPPAWLLPHQIPAVKRLAGAIDVFGGALLADGVGLGKTYMALALATRARCTTAVVPACILPQWERTAAHLGVHANLISHESLSRSGGVPSSDLVVVDEAHRFRNPGTRRYDRLARDIRTAHVLLVTATPVVNHARDLTHLLRLFLADGALAFLGVPSLERAAESGDVALLAGAADRLIVARSVTLATPLASTVPAVREGAVARTGVAEPDRLERFLTAATALTFPGASSGTAHLLRSHLLHRLASSLSAFRGTVTRHLAYADRALAGEAERIPPRQALRRILGAGDDLQFELWSLSDGALFTDCARSDLARERRALLRLLHSIDPDLPSPKAGRLEHLLQSRAGKTLVFTSSIETALELGRRLAWHRVGVVAAGKGRIATGPLGVQHVLDLFAPTARGITPTDGGRAPLDTLIATDLVSEGLDLQDAATIIHYDLPWTPVRLAQRIGRAVRLGSAHPQVDVLWFAPPTCLERHLEMERRLSRKAQVQLALSASTTSRVGRAQVFGQAAAAREVLCTGANPTPVPVTDTWCAVVTGPAALVAAVRWQLPTGDVDEVMAFAHDPNRQVNGAPQLLQLISELRARTATARRLPPSLSALLLSTVRERLRFVRTDAAGIVGRRLRRRVLQAGVRAAKRRDQDRLLLLDRVLERVHGGCAVGRERSLAVILDGDAGAKALSAWLADTPARRRTTPGVRVVAVLAGVPPQELANPSSSPSSPDSSSSSSS